VSYGHDEKVWPNPPLCGFMISSVVIVSPNMVCDFGKAYGIYLPLVFYGSIYLGYYLELVSGLHFCDRSLYLGESHPFSLRSFPRLTELPPVYLPDRD